MSMETTEKWCWYSVIRDNGQVAEGTGCGKKEAVSQAAHPAMVEVRLWEAALPEEEQA